MIWIPAAVVLTLIILGANTNLPAHSTLVGALSYLVLCCLGGFGIGTIAGRIEDWRNGR